jgi:isopenicillin N synthase-like dioxygenase
VAFFYNPDFKARIEYLPTCHDVANPPRFPACTAGEHMR